MKSESPENGPSKQKLTYYERMQLIIDTLEAKYISSLKLEELSSPHISKTDEIGAIIGQMKKFQQRLLPGITPDEYMIKIINKQEKKLGITK